MKNCIDEAYDLGAEVVRIIAGKDPGDAKREEAKKLLVDSLHQIMDYGKEEGSMKFTLKIFDRDIDKMNLIGHFSDALDIAKAVRPDYANFGLLADLSHFPLLDEKAEEAIPLIKDYLWSAHLGNCVFRDRKHPAYGDIQPRFGIPGGEIDTQEVVDFFHVLKDNGFFDQAERPIVSAEVRPVLAGETSAIPRQRQARHARRLGHGRGGLGGGRQSERRTPAARAAHAGGRVELERDVQSAWIRQDL